MPPVVTLWATNVGEPVTAEWCDACLLPSMVRQRVAITLTPLEPPIDPSSANGEWRYCTGCGATTMSRDACDD